MRRTSTSSVSTAEASSDSNFNIVSFCARSACKGQRGRAEWGRHLEGTIAVEQGLLKGNALLLMRRLPLLALKLNRLHHPAKSDETSGQGQGQTDLASSR